MFVNPAQDYKHCHKIYLEIFFKIIATRNSLRYPIASSYDKISLLSKSQNLSQKAKILSYGIA